jgi:Mn2+/Fe2+ NRAMP family transporter
MNRSNLLKALGPGILVACAAIGGSHLVWSTKAGALYGWQLLGLLLLANLLKFPFFLYGQRYTAATGKSLLQGYRDEGRLYIGIFLGINILTGVINIAGVSMLAAALLAGFGIEGVSLQVLTVLLMGGCLLIVLVGHYRALDGMAKAVVLVLTFSTLLAVALALLKGPVAPAGWEAPSPFTMASFGFLIMFMGWMPAPIDLSAWSSLWMFSREKQTGHFATVEESAIDFYLGYGMAVLMAVAFLALGALVMHGSGESFASGGIQFSRQLVSMYSANIGEWSHYLILCAAFVTMLSTSLTCIDGYPRALAASTTLLLPKTSDHFQRLHMIWALVAVAAACAIVLLFVSNLIQLLGFAAIVSFLTSPVLAIINFRVMTRPTVPVGDRPGWFLKALSWAGIAFFLFMAGGYLGLQLA